MNAQAILGVATTQRKIGDALLIKKDVAAACAAYHKAIEALEQLTRDASTNPMWRWEMAVTRAKLGDALFLSGQREEAAKELECAVEHYEALLKEGMEDFDGLSNLFHAHARLCLVRLNAGNIALALLSAQAASAHAKRLAKVARDRVLDGPKTLRAVAGALAAAKEAGAAFGMYHTGREICLEILAKDNENEGVQDECAQQMLAAAELCLECGDSTKALQGYSVVLMGFRLRVQNRPDSTSARRELALHYFRIARLMDLMGKSSLRDSMLKMCQETLEQMRAAGMSFDGELEQLSASIRTCLGTNNG